MKRGWCASLLLALVMPVVMVGCGGGKRPYVPLIEQNTKEDFTLSLLEEWPGEVPTVSMVSGSNRCGMFRVRWIDNERTVNISFAWQGTAPAGTTVQAYPASLPATEYSDFKFCIQTTAGTTVPADYTLRVSGNDGVRTRYVDVRVRVTGFTVSVAEPREQVIYEGEGASYSVTVTPLNGFEGDVSLDVVGLPGGFLPVFSENPVSLSDDRSPITVTLFLNPRDVGFGQYPFTVRGTSEGLEASSEPCSVTYQYGGGKE